MLKKILTMFLAVMLVTVASGVNAFARKGGGDENQTVAKRENQTKAGDLKAVVSSKSKSGELNVSDKSTLAEYERAKKQGRGFSTTTKVLIGVGIAAAVVGIVIFAASRDKVRTF